MYCKCLNGTSHHSHVKNQQSIVLLYSRLALCLKCPHSKRDIFMQSVNMSLNTQQPEMPPTV